MNREVDSHSGVGGRAGFLPAFRGLHHMAKWDLELLVLAESSKEALVRVLVTTPLWLVFSACECWLLPAVDFPALFPGVKLLRDVSHLATCDRRREVLHTNRGNWNFRTCTQPPVFWGRVRLYVAASSTRTITGLSGKGPATCGRTGTGLLIKRCNWNCATWTLPPVFWGRVRLKVWISSTRAISGSRGRGLATCGRTGTGVLIKGYNWNCRTWTQPPVFWGRVRLEVWVNSTRISSSVRGR